PNPALQLPRTLSRPAFTDISPDALAAAAPELATVPIEFIRHGLRAKAPAMQAGLAALAPSHLPKAIPRDRMPSSLTVPLRSSGAAVIPSYPTHVLAIATSSKSAPSSDAAVFPVHAVVLAAHCAKLPPLPPSRGPSASGAVTLPVLPFTLPSPPAFAILHTYMYTHRLDAALGALLPLPPAFLSSLASASSPSSSSRSAHSAHDILRTTLANPTHLHPLATHLAASEGGNLAALMAHAAHVKELWQDMVALGVYDPALWDALDLAWEVVLGAMNVAA
ncbi:hypothetical protein B0H12DRAFT_1003913, partial [Mycena haematopus]